MALRIKEVCKEKEMTMAEIAKILGISPVTLSQSLNGNPTLSRLTEVADALGVDVSELFVKNTAELQGCVFYQGKTHVIESIADIEALLSEIKENQA